MAWANSNGSWVSSSPFDGHFHHRIVGTIGNPTLLASWLAICVPFSLYLNNKRGIIGATLSLFIICLTNSVSCIAISIIGILFYLIISRKFKALIITCVILALMGGAAYKIIPKTELQGFLNPAGRVEVHKEAWKILQNRPLFGLGLGSFGQLIGSDPKIIERLGGEEWRQLHDEYGQVWFDIGLIGLMLVAAFLISVFRAFFKNFTPENIMLMTSLIIFMLLSGVLFMLRVSPTSFYGIIIMGLLLKTLNKETV